MKEQFEILLPLVLAGEANTEQERTFFELLEKDKQLEQAYQQALKVWLAASALSFDADKALAALHAEQNPVIPIRSTKWRIPAAAASVAILIGLVSFLTWQFVGTSKAQMAELVKVKSGNEIAKVDLPDGSIVWLNRHSTLEYPANFEGDERRVKLQGEGYFDIVRNEQKPFVTEMRGSETIVLGTEYNLKENGQDYELLVTEGKVSFGYFAANASPSLASPIIVQAGSAAILKHGSNQAQMQAADANTLAWKTHILVFEKASPEYIAHVMENVYGKKYVIKEPLHTIEFTGTFQDKGEETVRAILSESLNITFSDSAQYVLVGSGH